MLTGRTLCYMLQPSESRSVPTTPGAHPQKTIFGDVHSLLAYWTGQGSLPAGFDAPTFPAAAQIAIRSTNLASAVILGHSAGGRVANDMVTGET